MYDTGVEYARREALPAAAGSVEFTRATLGDHAGVVGAALIAAES